MVTYNVTNGSDSGAGSLREAVELANVNSGTDDILIQTDVQLNSAIEITESVNIGTPFGATITQTGDDRLFEIDDLDSQQESEINLYRLNLTGGNAELGGAIISYENLTITDSSLFDHSAEVDGAAVYVLGANLTVERSQFDNNQITSVKEEGDRDLYVFGGKLEVINSILDKTEPIVAEVNLEAEASLVTGDRQTAAGVIVNEVVVNESAIEITPKSNTQGDESLVVSNSESSLEEIAKNSNLLDANDGDIVSGSDGDDTINGSDSDDLLSGNDGNDTLEGGAGNDFLDGGTGDDNLSGNAGNDLIQDSSGKNIIVGNEGNDTLVGGRDLDYINGGAGDDDLNGGDGDDTLTGETGSDTLNGAAGNDTLLGSDGDDLIRGAGGNDIIHGHDGNDYLFGSTEDDILHGDGGNDTLSGDGGENLLTGGDGSDLFNLVAGGNSVIADFELGTDRLQLSQIAYSELNITGDVNSMLGYQGAQIGMILDVSPAELTPDNFVEV